MTESDFQSFEVVGALVVVLDVDGRIVHWNHRCSDLTGYSLDEVRGRLLWDFALLPEEVESFRALFATVREGALPVAHADCWVTKPGKRRWVAWSHALAKGPDGQIQYVIKTGIDQTESYQAQYARRASEAWLGAMVAENAQLLASARLAARDLREANEHMVAATIRAQELTEVAEVARGRAEASEQELRAVAEFREMFIGIVSHDLRSPLGSIRMAVEAQLQHGHLDDHDRSAAHLIVDSSKRMTRMIHQLLDLTRVRLAGFPIDRRPTDLRDVCSSVAAELGPAIEMEFEGDVTGNWDPDRLAQALSNVVGNAVEHASPGTPVVVRGHTEGAEVVVEIINRGEPIAADVLPHLFEPFQQAQARRSGSGNLGLGLYIAKQIVLAEAGAIEAHSVEGTTTFVVRLPRRAPPASAPLWQS